MFDFVLNGHVVLEEEEILMLIQIVFISFPFPLIINLLFANIVQSLSKIKSFILLIYYSYSN